MVAKISLINFPAKFLTFIVTVTVMEINIEPNTLYKFMKHKCGHCGPITYIVHNNVDDLFRKNN